ncbi:MAG: ArsR family transcriptional regulator [Methanomassiliicoccales archaeon]|nr:MAG: ArsR family transcriptional regulator [Methanomassiliicoccales archaeon]
MMRPKAFILICSVALLLAFSLSLVPQESDGASYVSRRVVPDISTDIKNHLNIFFLDDYNDVEAGSTIYVEARVIDDYFKPVDSVAILFTIQDPNGHEESYSMYPYLDGYIKLEFSPPEGVVGFYTINATADNPDWDGWNSIEVKVIGVTVNETPVLLYFQIGAVIAAFVSLGIASTEAFGYSLFNIFAFPLYSRIKKEEVLDHFVRGQIYGFIVSNPGEHYNSIREKLKVTNGTLSHHLRMLEIQGFIKSRKESIYRRFYPIEMKFPRDRGVKLSDLQITILGLMKGKSAPTQKEILHTLGISQQVASYNLRILTRKGFVQMRKDGRKRKYYLTDASVSGAL